MGLRVLPIISDYCDDCHVYIIRIRKPISTSHKEMGDVKTTKDLKYQMFLHSVRLSVVNIPNG